ncbi:hypothetical protein WH43_13645 [Rheinheimera sp. KL1]|uniref:hypothetical protein n=1 Tax=Rheinheimera sp. KL1 TaxID=1635005 RepID=UPI0006A97F0A|nr:hypothetical protein [Rheinheimera sp. KL1]KOO57556.1 hypothetical protein WH43_13645 [Rheinheimera sp. KL1]
MNNFEQLPAELKFFDGQPVLQLVVQVAQQLLPERYNELSELRQHQVASDEWSTPQALWAALKSRHQISNYQLLAALVFPYPEMQPVIRAALRLLLQLVFDWRGYEPGDTPSIVKTCAQAIRMVGRGKHNSGFPQPDADLTDPQLDSWLHTLLGLTAPAQSLLDIELRKVAEYLRAQRPAITKIRQKFAPVAPTPTGSVETKISAPLMRRAPTAMPAQVNDLNDGSLKLLTHFLEKKLVSASPIEQSNAAYLIALLLAGVLLPSRPQNDKTPSQNLIQREVIKFHEDGISVHYQLELPQGVNYTQKCLNDNFAVRLKYQWPCLVDPTLINDQKAKELLSEFNQANGMRLSQAVLARFQSTYFQRVESDSVLSSHLSGRSAKKDVLNNYVFVESGQLQQAKARYLQHIQTVTASEFLLPDCEVPQGWLGSTRVPEISGLLTDLFKFLYKRSDQRNLSRHNRIVLHTILILQLSTCHRPIQSPFERLNHFDHNLKTCRVNDKNLEFEPRIIVLPDLAQKQLTAYINHLRQTGERYASPQHLKYAAKAALQNQDDLFFFEDRTAVVPVTPSKMHVLLADVIEALNNHYEKNYYEKLRLFTKLPLNWYRHYLATHFRSLIQQGDISQTNFDYFFGHSEKSLAADGSDAAVIAKQINGLLLSLKIKTVNFNG